MKKTSLEKLEIQLRKGEGHLVRQTLGKLSPRFHPLRAEVGRWAQLAARAGQPERGLNWLYRYVRPSDRKPVEATSAEWIEYAGCLIKWGALREGQQILERFLKTPSPAPPVLLYSAYSRINAWEYGSAIPYLEDYLASMEPEPYPRMVAEINLISALSFERQYDAALARIESVVATCEKSGFHLARAKLFQIQAEIDIAQKRFQKAEASLDGADSLLADKESLDGFFIRKFRASLLAHARPKSKGALQALAAVEAEAVRRNHWETIRDIDRIRALTLGDLQKLRHLYFGSPYSAYRRFIELDAPPGFSVGDRYIWKLGARATEGKLELRSLRWSKRSEPIFKIGMASHRLLQALCGDFYRPLSAAAIFSSLFAGERYVPGHSGPRTRQALSRLRKELRYSRLPLEVLEKGGSYRLGSPRGIEILIESYPRFSSREDGLLDRLTQHFGSKEFDALAVSHALEISPRRAQLLLKAAHEAGRLHRLPGRGRYVLPPGPLSKRKSA